MIVSLAEPLARHGFWRVGGPMDRFVVVEAPEELEEELRRDGPLWVLGNGSNLLAPDRGLRGTTLRLGPAFRAVEVREELGDGRVRVRLGAGAHNAAVLARVAKLGLAGLGALAGVPGTVGGAVAMNAGTTLGEVGEVLLAVEGLDRDGRRRRIERAELPVAYREGGLPQGFLVTHAEVALRPDPARAEAAHIEAHLARRKATQPLDLPSCGSVFRNPPGDHAGRLVESVGLKGHRIGGAAISERHANFIVNLGEATSADVAACIRLAWRRVFEATGVRLVPEVHVIGDWEEDEWPPR